ncbi:MAG: PQQ-binding-like beta-propeller repeat protein [Myxococcota bacterium]
MTTIPTRLISALLVTSLLGLLTPPASADDWPQWYGPQRDGLSAEKGDLVSTWTEKGPKVRWTQALGPGFSSFAVVGDTGYTMATNDPHVSVVAFDVKTGKDRWRTRIGQAYTDRMGGDGPRATPTIHEGQLFALGPNGTLVAMDAKTGRLAWMRQIAQELGGEVPKWGYSGSPLVSGGLVYIEVGGKDDHSLVAFSAKDGKVVWKRGGFKAGYSSPALLTLAGTPQVVFFTAQAAVATRPKTGEVLWTRPWEISYDVSAATPIAAGPDALFISAGYGVGGVLYDLTRQGEKVAISQRWASPRMRNKMSTSVHIKGTLYGFDEDRLTAMDANSGTLAWQFDEFGRGSLIAVGDRLVVLGEDCRLAIVEATPKAYTPVKPPVRILPSDRCWTVPALSDGVLFVRDLEQMRAVELIKR